MREDGSACAPANPANSCTAARWSGLGYWNDPVKTAERYKPAPGQPAGLVNPNSPWSATPCAMDEDWLPVLIGRRDDMTGQTSGYRVSPTEVEEVLPGPGLVAEAAAIGVAHGTLRSQAVVAVIQPGRRRPADDGRSAARTASACCRTSWCRSGSLRRAAACRAIRTARSTANATAGELETLYAETGA